MKKIMIQGTSSSAGKSLITSGLCRIFYEDGYKVSPFKSQNMTLNTYVDMEGKEMGRAQAIQSECGGESPRYYMNPILLKPTSDKTSDIILNGEFYKELEADEYYKNIDFFKKIVSENFQKIEEKYDICVIEGGGSPAEINFRNQDIVNMGLAEMVDTPVILVANIEFGGVFASLLGTILLLEKKDRDRIKGIIINKFRGDKELLKSGIDMFQKKLAEYGCNIEILGILPYEKLNIEEEDSLNIQKYQGNGNIKIGILKYPRISDFNEFNFFKRIESLEIVYIENEKDFEGIDILILPNSNNVILDLEWIRELQLDKKIVDFSKAGKKILGIAGGVEILGKKFVKGKEEFLGLGLLDIETVIENTKNKKFIEKREKIFGENIFLKGYINNNKIIPKDRVCFLEENIFGIRIAGVVENTIFIEKFLGYERNFNATLEEEYKKLSTLLRENLDIEKIYRIISK